MPLSEEQIQEYIDKEKEEAISRIEGELQSKGAGDEYYKFRTFLILNLKISDWEKLSSSPIEDIFSKYIRDMPIPTVINLFRRHPKQAAYFLHFFDNSKDARMKPKSYLPFLCQIIHKLPIQWVVRHLSYIENVRYSYQLLTSAFGSSIIIEPNQMETIQEQDEIWFQYRNISPAIPDISRNEAWEKMTYYRTAMRELIDFKLNVHLSSYIKLDKTEIVKRLLNDNSYSSLAKYKKSINEQIINFCKYYGIPLYSIIISSLLTKDWSIEQKLQIIKEYIKEPNEIRKAITSLKFHSNELEIIEKFAKKYSISFEPDPNKFIIDDKSFQRKKNIQKSPSSESLSENSFIELSKKMSFSSSDIKKELCIYGSLSQLANGEPNDPYKYANKLKNYRVFSDINGIYDLASIFNVIVKYEEFIDPYSRKHVFIQIFKADINNFVPLCSIFKFTDDELINMLCITDDFIDYAEFLIPTLIHNVQRSNCEIYLQYTFK